MARTVRRPSLEAIAVDRSTAFREAIKGGSVTSPRRKKAVKFIRRWCREALAISNQHTTRIAMTITRSLHSQGHAFVRAPLSRPGGRT